MNRQDDKQRIAQLLSKFMTGETTLNEEQTLATYFRTHDVDEEWTEYKEMFALFDSGQVEAPCDSPAGDELKANPSLYIDGSRKAKHIPLWPLAAAVAASILLLLVSRFSQEPGKEQPVVAETFKKSIPQPAPQPIVEDKKEEVVAEVEPTTQPVKKRKKAVIKQSTAIEELTLAQAEPVEEMPVAMEMPPNSYADIEAEMRDIRNQGERVEAMVAAITRSY